MTKARSKRNIAEHPGTNGSILDVARAYSRPLWSQRQITDEFGLRHEMLIAARADGLLSGGRLHGHKRKLTFTAANLARYLTLLAEATK